MKKPTWVRRCLVRRNSLQSVFAVTVKAANTPYSFVPSSSPCQSTEALTGFIFIRFRYISEGRNSGPPLPVAEEGDTEFPQRSKNRRISASPNGFSGTARRSRYANYIDLSYLRIYDYGHRKKQKPPLPDKVTVSLEK